MRSVVVIVVLLMTLSANAQKALRTFAVENIRSIDDSTSLGYTAHWSFYYNDSGVMDSLQYSTRDVLCQLGGLDKMKPFISEFYDWETMPPNIGGLSDDIYHSRRLVITEPEPGKIRIYRSWIVGKDSIEPDHAIHYDYDPKTLRVFRMGSDTFAYRDSAGLLVEIKRLSRLREADVWKLHRDTDGVIIGIEQYRPRLRGDSLMPRTWHQILSWKRHDPFNSARRDRDLFFKSYWTHFPWLAEGEPAAWLTWTGNGISFAGPKLFESTFDSLGRLVRESGKKIRTITYHDTGPIVSDRVFEGSDLEKNDRLVRRRAVKGVVWRDFVISYTPLDTWSKGRSHSFQYEYGYRYGDSILGDRMAHNLWYEDDNDTIKLTIKEPLSINGLTACIIDTTETEIAQIPLTGRETSYILNPSVHQTMFAIRWKYHDLKVVDQAFF